MRNFASAREELRVVGYNSPHQSSVMLKLLGTRELIITVASEVDVPEAPHHPVVGTSRCFLELAVWQEASKHANLSFQTKIKEGRDFCWFFLFSSDPRFNAVWLTLPRWTWCVGSATDHGVGWGSGSLQDACRKKSIHHEAAGRISQWRPGSGIDSTMRHFYMHQLTKSIPGKKK